MTALKGLQGGIIGSGGHPADGAQLEDAAGNLDGVLGLWVANDRGFGALNPERVGSEFVRAVLRSGEIEALLQLFRGALGKARKFSIRQPLTEAAEGKLQDRDNGSRRTVPRGQLELDALNALLFFFLYLIRPEVRDKLR